MPGTRSPVVTAIAPETSATAPTGHAVAPSENTSTVSTATSATRNDSPAATASGGICRRTAAWELRKFDGLSWIARTEMSNEAKRITTMTA